MKKLFVTASLALSFATSAIAAENVKATVHANQAGAKINREIYGQFSEHLSLNSYIYTQSIAKEKSQAVTVWDFFV